MRFLLIIFLAALGACTSSRYLLDGQALDSVRASGAIASLRPRKVVVRGPLIVQAGTGNSASIADNRKAGQRQGAAATAPGATATATTKRAGLSWWVVLLGGLGAVAGWEWLSTRLVPLKWLPWRARAT